MTQLSLRPGRRYSDLIRPIDEMKPSKHNADFAARVLVRSICERVHNGHVYIVTVPATQDDAGYTGYEIRDDEARTIATIKLTDSKG